MSKNKSNKSTNLKSLIILPLIANASIKQMQISNLKKNQKFEQSDFSVTLEEIKEKFQESMSTNIKRLEKIKVRLLESSQEGKSKSVIKINEVLDLLKKKETQEIESFKDYSETCKELINKVLKNDVNLIHVFDGRKDVKSEKFYTKLGKHFHEVEKNIGRFSDDRKVDILKVVQKGYRLIEQLKNEEKYTKAKSETKRIRRELANCFNQIKYYI